MVPDKATSWLSGLALLLLAGCSTSKFEEPEMHGPPVMVAAAGQPRLWVLTRQEEVRTVGVGSGGRGSTLRWRDDTYFHFQVQAFDPATARPLWSRRLLTIGDEKAAGPGPSRVIGSAAHGQLLGQDGDVTPPPPAPPVERLANGRERIVPLMPLGEVPARLAKIDGQWLALYSEKEAADAASDDRGDNLRYPWQVLNEGALVRRALWRPRIVSARRFDDVFERIEALEPIPSAPSFLKGRFFRDLATGQPMAMASPAGLMVWHSTRIDSAGRLVLTRLDAQLATVWTAELPLVESSTATPVTYWQLPDRVVAMGTLETMEDGVRRQAPHLVSVSLADGTLHTWNLTREAAVP